MLRRSSDVARGPSARFRLSLPACKVSQLGACQTRCSINSSRAQCWLARQLLEANAKQHSRHCQHWFDSCLWMCGGARPELALGEGERGRSVDMEGAQNAVSVAYGRLCEAYATLSSRRSALGMFVPCPTS
eukprot:3112553-Rhodomonas_salina.2